MYSLYDKILFYRFVYEVLRVQDQVKKRPYDCAKNQSKYQLLYNSSSLRM